MSGDLNHILNAISLSFLSWWEGVDPDLVKNLFYFLGRIPPGFSGRNVVSGPTYCASNGDVRSPKGLHIGVSSVWMDRRS